ncbi:UNVERIFIED_CONTAM: hypothetical protein FKN15_017958 [Acipenser sinensis]
MPEEELTSSPEAVPPVPEEGGRSTDFPQSGYKTGGTEAEAVAVESGGAAEKDGADGEEDEGMYETDDSQPVRKKLYTLQYICNFLDSTKVSRKSTLEELNQQKMYRLKKVVQTEKKMIRS